MASYDVTTAAAWLEFENTNNGYNEVKKIDDNHFITFYYGTTDADGYVQVFSVNTSTWEVTTAATRLEFDTNDMYEPSAAQIDSNHFILFWGGPGTDGYVQTFAVNTSTWAVTTASASLEFDTGNGRYNCCCKIDPNHFVNFTAGTDSDGFAQVFVVDTSTYAVTTAASALEFDTQNGRYHSCFAVDSSHVLNFWLGGATTTDGFVQVFAVNTSTWEVTTAATALQFDTDVGSYNSGWQIDSNHFINFWSGVDGDGFAQVFAVNTSTWAVTTAASSLEFDTTLNAGNSCYQIDSTHYVNFWAGEANDGYAQVFTVNTSTWAVTTAAASLEFDTTNCADMRCAQIDSSHYLLLWKGADSDGFTQVFSVEVPAADTGERYWIGGTGTWSDTDHWSYTSGGDGGVDIPTENEDVFIDENSGFGSGGTITIDGDSYGKSLTCTSGDTFTITDDGNYLFLYFYGDVILEAGCTIDGACALEFAAGSAMNFNPNGATIAGMDMVAAGGLTLLGDVVSTMPVNINAGTFDADTYDITAMSFNLYVGVSATVNMGSGTWLCSGEPTESSGKSWNVTVVEGASLTLNEETSTIKIDNTGYDTDYSFVGGDQTYNNLWVTGSGGGVFSVTGSNTFNDFKVDGAPAIIKFTGGTTTTVSTFTVSGTEGNLITIDSVDGETQHDLSKETGTVDCDYLDLSNSNATGGATWNAGANSLDTENNDGWVFPSSGTTFIPKIIIQ